jgi:hypothetical protein
MFQAQNHLPEQAVVGPQAEGLLKVKDMTAAMATAIFQRNEGADRTGTARAGGQRISSQSNPARITNQIGPSRKRHLAKSALGWIEQMDEALRKLAANGANGS